jgi:hypothetical protein
VAIGGRPGDEYNDSRHDFRAGLQTTLKDRTKWEDLKDDIEHQVKLKGGAGNVRIFDIAIRSMSASRLRN